MATTYEIIGQNTLASATTEVFFNSISATYKDLLIKVTARSDDNTNTILQMQLNSDTTTNYSNKIIRSNGDASVSGLNYATTRTQFFFQDGMVPDGNSANMFSSTEIYLPSYGNTRTKALCSIHMNGNNSTVCFVSAGSALYRGTSAISSIRLFAAAGNFMIGSSFYLYGIKNS